MATQELIRELESRGRLRFEIEPATLEARKQEELQLHDQKRDAEYLSHLEDREWEDLKGDLKFYRAAADSEEYIRGWMEEHCPGKALLDYACGNGLRSIRAAKAGASVVVGIDLSSVSVKNAAKAAELECPGSAIFFVQGDCENTRLPDASFDIIVCSGMLHHVDLSYAFPEIRRLLKPGGIAFGYEALAYNPLIKLYRRLTPRMRTKWEAEHILSYGDLRFAGRFFSVQNVKHWTLLGLLGFYLPAAMPFFRLLDRLLLSMPLIKLMSWTFTFELHNTKRA